MDRFFADAAGDAAKFPEFAFLEPKYFGLDQNDDHPPHNIMKAQKLIADVYNAIRSNDPLWESTLLAVVYDEHGGFYDHLIPPRTIAPDSNQQEYTFDQLGVRVPAILVSPWLDATVASTQFDHTSLLRYLQKKWDLGSLGARTAQANSIEEAFGARTSIREDTVAFIRVPNSQLVPEKPDWERQDVATHHDWLHLVADTLDAPDEALGEAIEVAARAAEALESGFARSRAAIGDGLIAWGRALRAPLENAQADRVERTRQAVGKLIPKGR
jgi:phospholipase C